MGTTTTNHALYKPDLGEAGSSWYDDVNANFDKLDSILVSHNTDGSHDRINIGTTSPLGKIHVKDGVSGATPFFNDDRGIIVERDTNAVVQWLTTNTGHAYLQFGDPQSGDVGHIVYKHDIDALQLVVGQVGISSFYADRFNFLKPIGVNIGTDVPGAMTEIKGVGNGSGTYTLALKNSDSLYSLVVVDNRNVGFGTPNQFGGGIGVIGIANAVTLPTANPTGGGVVYNDAGALKYRSPNGTITTMGPL